MSYRVYLAGPDVFRKDAKERAEKLKAILRERDLEGVFPLDVDLKRLDGETGPAFARRIFMANVRLIRSTQGVLANVEPFRGPSADVGTAWEMGFAKALGLPVVAYAMPTNAYEQRVHRNIDDMLIEDFGLSDNLMIACGADETFVWLEEAADVLGVLMEANR